MLFCLKLPFSFRIYILKICQQSSLSMPKLPYAELSRVMRYEYVYTLQQQQKCIFSLKMNTSLLFKVNLLKKLQRAKISQFLSIYYLKCRSTKIIRFGQVVLQIFLVERARTINITINLINSPLRIII